MLHKVSAKDVTWQVLHFNSYTLTIQKKKQIDINCEFYSLRYLDYDRF